MSLKKYLNKLTKKVLFVFVKLKPIIKTYPVGITWTVYFTYIIRVVKIQINKNSNKMHTFIYYNYFIKVTSNLISYFFKFTELINITSLILILKVLRDILSSYTDFSLTWKWKFFSFLVFWLVISLM